LILIHNGRIIGAKLSNLNIKDEINKKIIWCTYPAGLTFVLIIMITNRYLFVYGTLLQPGNTFAAYLKKHCSFYGEGRFKGLLYDAGQYPGALFLPAGDNFVYGHIFLMDNAAAVLKVLDDYEGFGAEQLQPNEFIRELVDISEDVINCWVYLYNWPVEGLKLIESGRYS
jgi:gamma-glutamylcyclotransferase (GGCT)/AIG2-like uncharacterized protein YtfP